MVAKSNDDIVGFLLLHHTESTGAWEIGTVSVVKGQPQEELYEILIQGAYDAIGVLQNHGILERVWMVKRVRHADKSCLDFFKGLGFKCPSTWVENVISNEGYVPFDPFEAFLLKRAVVPGHA